MHGAGRGEKVRRPGAAHDVGVAEFVDGNGPSHVPIAAAQERAIIKSTAVGADLQHERVGFAVVGRMIPGYAAEYRAEVLGAGVAGDVGVAQRVQSDAIAFVFSEKRQGVEPVDVADGSAIRVKPTRKHVYAMLRRTGT